MEARLQAVEVKRNELQQQALRAQQAADAGEELDRIERKLETLQQEKATMTELLGFDPALTAAALDRFVRLVQNYEQAHNKHETAKVAIERLDGEIETLAGQIQRFLNSWQADPVEDDGLDALDICLEGLRDRVETGESSRTQ